MAQQPNYNIWIRNLDVVNPLDPTTNKLRIVGLVTNYSQLEFKIRYNNVGGWVLKMPGGTDEAELLKRLLVGSPSDPANETTSGRGYGGIVVSRNGRIVFSGPVRGFEETGDYIGSDGKNIEFFGCDDNCYLNARIPMAPAQATAGDPPDNGTGVPLIPNSTSRYFVAPFLYNWHYYIHGGATRTTTQIISNLFRTNIGDEAPLNIGQFANRRIPFLDYQIPSFGPTGFWSRSRYSGTLLEKIQAAATYTVGYTAPTDIYASVAPYQGAAFRILQTDQNRLLFSVWDPRDPQHNRGAVFSVGRGNLGSYKLKHQAPEVNFAVVGGQADDNDANRNGSTRWFAHRAANQIGQDPTKYGLWEGYIDRRDIQYTNPRNKTGNPGNPPNQAYIDMNKEFIDAMDVYLREQGEQINIEVVAINTPPTVWAEDYNVGDWATVVVEGYTFQDIVRDVTVTLTKENGEVVVPTIGNEATGMSLKLLEKFDEIDGSLNNLNASQ